MKGNIFVILLLSFTLLFGATLWYFQNYAYYERNDVNDMTITLMGTGSKINVELDEIKSINSSTSPLKFRSCLKINSQALETIENYLPYSEGIPLRAPNWFKCFNVKNITNDYSKTFESLTSYVSKSDVNLKVNKNEFEKRLEKHLINLDKLEFLEQMKVNIKNLMEEVVKLLSNLETKDYEKTKNFIKETKYLFKGATGVRHVDFIGYKNNED